MESVSILKFVAEEFSLQPISPERVACRSSHSVKQQGKVRIILLTRMYEEQ